MSWKTVRALVVCAILVTIASLSDAQTTVGSVYGAVTDPSGAAIPGAQVALTDVRTGKTQSGVTDSKGDYLFSTVQPSDYRVKVTAQGFQAQTQTGITVSANVNVHVPVALTVGGATESVEVEAGVTLVDTREAQIGDTIDQRRVANLPTLNRDTYSLLQTVTGVSSYNGDTLTGSRGGTSFSVNGFPANTPSFYLDGAYDNAFKQNGGNKAPNPDALQEFRVITSNFDAEFGRSPGAVVNMITKSGTSRFHGSAYDYIRNDAFDARNFFNPAPNAKATLRQNQFGATLGGPIPVLKNTFFFLSWEHLIYHTTALNSGLNTLTALERTGDFSQSIASVNAKNGAITRPNLAKYDSPSPQNPTGNGACPGISNANNPATYDKLCAAAIDPVAAGLLKFIPVNPGNGTAVQLRAPNNSTDDQGLARIDYNGFSKHQIHGTFFNAVGGTQDPGAGGNGGIGLPGSIPQYSGMNEVENQMNAILADDWTLTNRTVNSIRGFYTSNRYIITNQINNHFLANLGSGAPEGGDIYAPPEFAVTGFFQLGPNGAGPSDINQIQFGLVDTATLQRGKHAIKLGASWDSNKYSEDGNATAQGVYTFNTTNTGYAFSDFLTGQANALNQSGSVHHRQRNQDPAAFVQDDWQITSRLNLNLGVRWELAQPYVGDDTEGNVVPGQQSTVIPGAPAGILVTGDKGVPAGGFTTSWNRFAPRVGLAYDVFGDGRTSLRAGYGIFFNQFTQGDINNLDQEPFVVSQKTGTPPNLECPYGGAFTGGTCVSTATSPVVTPFPFTFSKSNSRFYTNTDLSSFRPGEKSNPYANEFNLSVEQQLTRSVALRVSYLGSTYMKQYINLDINTPVFYPNASISETPATGVNGINCRRPYQPYRVGGPVNATNCTFRNAAQGGYSDAQAPLQPLQFGAITEFLPINNQSYNSLQVNLRGKIKQLDFNSSYVWGKALNFTTPTVDQTNIRYNHGAADVDLRNRFTFSASYRTPTIHKWGFVGKQILSGWGLNDITILQSGNPFTVSAQTDFNRDGNTNDRINIVGNPYRQTHGHIDIIKNGYLNTAALQYQCAIPVDSTCTQPYGNEQRNSLYTVPNYQNNVSAFKEFALYRDVRFQFRAETFNLFNYVHLTGVRTNLPVILNANTTNFFQSADAARRVQFAAKILF